MKRVGFILLSAVCLATGGSLRADATNAALVRTSILESNVVCLRISRVAAGLAEEMALANRASTATNKIIGTILDLRFADGDAAAPVKPVVELFAAQKLPLAILVNGQTRGAALALAVALRAERRGLVFGSAAAELKPDIEVAVGADEEKSYFADAYAVLTNGVTLTVTNLAGRDTNRSLPRISEADLVRARREGAEDPEEQAGRTAPPPVEKRVVRDPVLARALDLLKGLAVIRQRRD